MDMGKGVSALPDNREVKIPPWAYGKEKIRGAERNLPDFFGLCPSCQKKFSGETFQNCCREGEGGVITENSY